MKNGLQDELIFMLRHDPHVRGGIMRFQNCCVNVSMNWKEGGKDLVAPLSRHMRRHFNDFLRQSVESCLYAGFVPFIVTRVDNIPTPVCLPIGSYSWATEIRPCKRKRKDGEEGGGQAQAQANQGQEANKPDNQLKYQPNILIYRVQPISGSNIDANEIYVYPYTSPVKYHSHGNDWLEFQSPMSGLLRLFRIREETRTQVLMAAEWNSKKHICMSENVDLKDQTTTGIQLLDELRRYKLTGSHANLRDSLRMKNKNDVEVNNVNEGQFQWIRSEFNEEVTPGATAHILPPNHELHELAVIPHCESIQYAEDAFARAVSAFFDTPLNNGQVSGGGGSGGAGKSGGGGDAQEDQMSRAQYEVVLSMTQFLSQLGEEVYAKCFSIEASKVELKLTPAPRIDLNTGDLKDLFEAGVLKDYDKIKVRKRYHMDY